MTGKKKKKGSDAKLKHKGYGYQNQIIQNSLPHYRRKCQQKCCRYLSSCDQEEQISTHTQPLWLLPTAKSHCRTPPSINTLMNPLILRILHRLIHQLKTMPRSCLRSWENEIETPTN